MGKDVVALKIDFKIDDRGIVRIIDLGDGFAADLTGFEDISLDTKILNDIHEATGATLATVFGELPYGAMQPQSIHIPFVLRQPASAGKSLTTDDLPADQRVLPYSYAGRISSFVSSAWGHQKENIFTAPIALMAVEMHKILWYFLMQKHLASAEQQAILYWSNDTSPTEVDLSTIDSQHGIFIKIGDRSIGGANDVHYAKDKNELLEIITQLHNEYNTSKETFRKHIFIMEPAYMTLKQLPNNAETKEDKEVSDKSSSSLNSVIAKGKSTSNLSTSLTSNRSDKLAKSPYYNATGRAFLTLIYDKTAQTLDVKIAAAKWMYPLAAIQENKSKDQMLSNIKNSIKMLSLSTEELKILSSAILKIYGDTFKAGFNNDDLMLYCADHPCMKKFLSCLRPNASYLAFLDAFHRSHRSSNDQNALMLIHGLIDRDKMKSINILLQSSEQNRFFIAAKPTLENLMKGICTFSFIECYVAHLKTGDTSYHKFLPSIPKLISKEALIKSSLDSLISRYLALKEKYDTKDYNRALRQAAAISDITVMKLLIYTRRADVNALSSANTRVLDCALASKEGAQKEQALLLLNQVGAKIGQETKLSSTSLRKP